MKINITEIFNKHLDEELKERDYDSQTLAAVRLSRSYDNENNLYMQHAIKEIVEAVIDRCAEGAFLSDESYTSAQEGSTCEIDKNSILAIKQEIIYE